MSRLHLAGTGAPLDQIEANACPPPANIRTLSFFVSQGS